MAAGENINPKVLVWARESAGLSLEEAAKRLGFKPTASLTAVEKLEALERGDKAPTSPQLIKFATIYRRPLLTFYMEEPPRVASRGEDFRTFSFAVSARESAKLDALLRDIRARQDMVKSILEDDEEPQRLDFVASVAMPRGVQFVVNSIAAKLEYKRGSEPRNSGTAEDLFKDLRMRAERIGIFVLLIGDLGSHHSTISERVFRGFAIADPIAPFVVINDQDARTARAFTLIHELAHIWLGQTGISGTADEVQATTPHGQIEQFCNDVAGEFLLPGQALANRPEFEPADSIEAGQMIARVAQTWRVSEPMVAYRLHRLGWISHTVYGELSSLYAARWNALKARAKEQAKEQDTGPSYYTVRQFKLGNALLGFVDNAMRNKQITHTKAAKVLGISATSVESLLRNYQSSRGAIVPEIGRQ